MEARLGQLEWYARATDVRLGAAEQHIEITGQLAARLDSFAAGVAAHSSRLDGFSAAQQQAIETLAKKFEDKLKIIEEAFKECDDRLKELQQATYAAPAAGLAAPPGMTEAPGLALLRGRLDELALEALTGSRKHAELNDKHQELKERIIAMDLTFRDGHADMAYQLVQEVGGMRTDVTRQIAGIEQRIAAGTCKCPTSCSWAQARAST